MNGWLSLEEINFGMLIESVKWLFELAFTPTTQISRVIIPLIGLLTLIILGWALCGLIQIGLAYLKYRALRSLLIKKKDTDWKPAEIDALTQPGKVDGWMSHKIQAIRSLREDVNAAMDDVNHIDAGIAWRIHGILRFPMGALIMFGLLGTVWGLQASIYSLLPTMQSKLDLLQLQKVMAGTLAGMQTAFSTTLAGLVGSLVTGFVIFVLLKTLLGMVLQAQNSLLVNHLVPKLSVLGTDHLQALVDQNKELKKTVLEVAEQSELLFQPIVEAASGLKSSVDQFFSAAHTMEGVGVKVGALGEHIESGLERVGSSFEVAAATLEKFNATQERIEDSVSNFNTLPEHFEKLLKDLEAAFTMGQERQAQSNQQIVGEQLTELKGLVGDVKGVIKNQRDEETNLVAKLTDTTNTATERMSEGITGLMERLAGTITQVESANTAAIDAIKLIQSGQEKVGQAYLTTFKEQMGKVEAGFSALLEQARRDENCRNHQIVSAITEWVAYNQYLSKMMINLDELPKRLGDQIATQSKKMANQL